MAWKDFFEWAFNGIGTWFIGMLLSFFLGYKVGIHRSIIQNEIAGDNANQSQLAKLNEDCSNYYSVEVKSNVSTTVVQNQTAGNYAVQKQEGELYHVRK